MKIAIDQTIDQRTDYRDVRVRSLYNVDAGQGERFQAEFDLPDEDDGWQIGLVVGPSGSGKSSIGRALEGNGWKQWDKIRWPRDRSIVSAIGHDDDFDTVTNALAQVGLGTVPSWLRPHRVLSNGEQFRADLARVLVDRPDRVVIDEFTSVVDRQIAQIGAMAFGKAWRRGPGQAVLLTCHYDVVEWLQPDWVLDTRTGQVQTKECLQPATPDPVGDLRRLVGLLEA